MKTGKKNKIVVVNQASNYLTIGICNELVDQFDEVQLITGSIHVQGEELSKKVEILRINKFTEKSLKHKFVNWIYALFRIYFILLFKSRNCHIFYITNPPMGYMLSFFLRNKFSILMWDVYPDMLSIFGISSNNIYYRLWTWCNKRLFKRAEYIFTIGHKISGLISNYVENDKIKIIPLWTVFNTFIPLVKQDNLFVRKHDLQDKFIVQYSGNIGITHNVEVLLELAKRLKEHKNILIQIIGRGTRVKAIQKKIKENKIENCQWLPFQSDKMFPFSLSAASIGVVILDDRTSQGSVPSKTYNLMKAGKPILYIASENSEMAVYAKKFQNGFCCHSSEIDSMTEYVIRMSKDQDHYKKQVENSIEAAKYFTRDNASFFGKIILQTKTA